MAISKIKSDSIDSIAAAKIPNLDAAKITTGSIADARVPASAVTQHVTATDLTPAHQGIAKLGLIMATEHNRVAGNYGNTFIDIFQDDTGITTETNVDRNASEYVSTVIGATTNATGTLISDTQTVASTSAISGIFTYTDSAGTNTIGTDLKIYFTANNGTNWTEAASYGTATTFSGSIKQVKLGKTTVTAGTQVAVKAVWANQSGSTTSAYETGDRRASITVTHSGFASWGEGQPNGLIVDGGNADQYQTGSRFVFATATPSAGAYIRFQFSTAKLITEAKWVGCTSASGVWKWQGSNDGSSFTDIGSSFTLVSNSGWQGSVLGTFMTMTSLSGNTTSYLYYQIAWVSGATYGGDYQVEVEFKVSTPVGVKVAHLNGWAVNY